MLLASVQNLDEYLASVWCPGDVGQIPVVSELVSLYIYGLSIG